ncbi:hypothetical protein REPUB_Repub05bG0131500 [Reevesia pubescens]
MESDILDISGEDDDSLLLQHHQGLNHDVSFFSSSPLHFPTSIPPDEKAKNPSLSFNNNVNKSELPKLSLEPHQMKRKKKSGGYNLRKSIAWNHAFFTEEGVLNSTELSLISGNFGTLSEEKFSVIEEEEERGESLSGDSPDLQALENNLFNELPLNNNSSNKKVEKKIGSRLLQKSSSPAPPSAVKQNVLSIHDVNRSGSKRSGCPRPVIPANVSTTKTAVKEPKISKIPAPKLVSSVLSTTANSAPNINKPKQNQNAQAAVSAHRSIGLTVSNKSTRSTQNNAKSSLFSRSEIPKFSAQQAKRNVRSSALASHSSTYSQHQVVTKEDNGLKVSQDPVMAAGQGSTNHEAGSSKIASLPQIGCQNGGNTQYAQPRMEKPSGLRMPSPSLGFFTQSKTNASQNLRISTQPCYNPKSNIPKLQKLGVLSSICGSPTPSVKVDVVANDVAAIAHARMSSTEPSVPSSGSILFENIRPDLRESKMPRVEAKVLCNSDNHELTNNQKQFHANDNDLKKQIENVGVQCTNNKLLLQSQSSEQVKVDCKRRADLVIPGSPDHKGVVFKDPHFISHHSLQIKGALKADDVGNQLSGNEHSSMENFDPLSELHSSAVNINGSPKVNDDQISIHDSHEQSNKQAEQAKPCTFDDDQIINVIERPHINEGTLLKEGEPSEKFRSCNSMQSKGICPEVRDCSASELERTNGLSCHRDRIQGKDGTGGADDLNLQSHVGDEQMHAFEGNLSLKSSSGFLNASEVDNQHTLVDNVNKKLVEQPTLPNPGVVVETVFQDNYGSHSTDCLIHGEIFSPAELLTKSNLQNVKDISSEIADACRSEMENSTAPCWIPPALQNCVHEMAEAIECLHVENSFSVSTDTQGNIDIELLSEASCKGIERIGEDQVHGVITACDIGVSNDGQSSGDLNGSEMDNSHSISHLSPVMEFKRYIGVDDITDIKSVESNHYCLSAKCNSSISEPGEKITCRHVDASSAMLNSSTDKQNDCEMSIAQAELIQSSFKAGKAFQENQSPEKSLSLFSVEGKYFESSQNFDSNNSEDVTHRDKSSVRQAVEGPSDLSQVELRDEPNENCAAGANETTIRSFEEGAHMQSFDDGISFDSCKSNLFTSAENNNFEVVKDLNEPPELQNVVIVEPIMSDKFGLSVNEEISSSVKIELSDNNHDCFNDMIKTDNEQSGEATSLNFELSSLSEDQISGAGNTCKSQAFCSLNKKQDAPVVKPLLTAVPFSDEWLAAIEAAGEEILTMKSGAVQNSPKEKSLPEPGPWSPVRRKNNQEIGPFDCTKFTNANIPPASD